jgi:proteic killer suppression protein
MQMLMLMIQFFADREAEKVFKREHSRRLPTDIQRRAFIRLRALDAAEAVEELLLPPSNRLHLLGGDRKGTWVISINAQWRITFTWGTHGPENVKIEDYH